MIKKVCLLVLSVFMLCGCQAIDDFGTFLNESLSNNSKKNAVISPNDPIEIINDKTRTDEWTIRVAPMMTRISVGHSDKIYIADMPKGYSFEDLKIYSKNKDIATVNPRTGDIYAHSPGNVIIFVETKDGRHNAQVNVSVTEDFTLDWDRIF